MPWMLGSRDSVGYYLTPTRHRGVWLIDRPDFAPDADPLRCAWLVVDLPEEVVRRYECRRRQALTRVPRPRPGPQPLPKADAGGSLLVGPR